MSAQFVLRSAKLVQASRVANTSLSLSSTSSLSRLSTLSTVASGSNAATVGRRFHSSTSTPSTTGNSNNATPQTTGTTDGGAVTQQTGQTDVVVNSSEELQASDCSGAPAQLLHRTVRIYQPTRNAMQSGGAKGEKWRIDWDTLPGAGRWENPLMGWASSGDYMQGTRLNFTTVEDAERFAQKQGWSYYVQQPTVKRIPSKNYSENYVYKPNKLRIARTK